MTRFMRCLPFWLLGLLLAGCSDFQVFSWSPDGRYLVCVDPNGQQAWLWDTAKQQPASIPGIAGAEVARFTYVSNSAAFVFGSNFHLSQFFSPEAEGLVQLNVRDGGVGAVPDGEHVEWHAVSLDGKQLATIRTEGTGDDRRHVIAVAPVDRLDDRRVLGEFREDVIMPAFDRSGTRLIATKGIPDDELPEGAEEGSELIVLQFSGETVETQTFARSVDAYAMGARFVGDDAFVYYRVSEEGEEDGVGPLLLQRLDGGDAAVLHDPAFAYLPPSVHTDGRTVAFTGIAGAIPSWDELSQQSVQVMTIDVETREKKTLTDETFGAYAPTFDPASTRIAYGTGGEAFSVKILDLATGNRQFVWRDDEERLLVSAERMMENGDTGMGLATIDELFHRFPETRFRARAAYLKLAAHLESPLNEFDEAIRAFADVGEAELRIQARELLWERPDAHIADPAGDAIRTYQTETSVNEYGLETDGMRDLTNLAVRATPDRLYLRAGFGSNYDLGGSAFSDLFVLIHEVGRDDAWHAVTPNVEWEWSPVRTIVIRHWYEQGQTYDLEILDENGATIARYAGTGFAPPAFPLFDLFDVDYKDNAIACWIDWRTIGLHSGKEYDLQVCTAKGGIESYKGYERPRETDSWDIADAFGDTNTRERIDAEIASGSRPKLLGHALKLQLPRRDVP